jgi:hypothetical protein
MCVGEACYGEYARLEGLCACRPILIPFFALATLIVSTIINVVVGIVAYVFCIFAVFIVPCIYASIPAIKDSDSD